MRIKNIIKNYPVTIYFISFILIGVSIIFLDSKIYATDTNNTPGCSCSDPIPCTRYQSLPTDSYLCGTTTPPNCTCKYQPTLLICPGKYFSLCSGTVVISSGCNSSTRACTPEDCNPKCDTPMYSNCPNCDCGGCLTYEEMNRGQCIIVRDPAFGNLICDNSCRYRVVPRT